MNIPDDLLYATSHEWLRRESPEGGLAAVGISDHAQHELTDVVYVELPEVGAQVSAGQQVCVVESVKAASDIYAPASGTIEAVNPALSADPSLINTDPYGAGWIFKLSLSDPAELGSLKTPQEYASQIG
jgi:glycine cleavage system H protein